MMQDNNFDKNIGLQLHDINIHPSPDVWIAVEKELDKKKRRYFFVWWLVPVLLVGVATVLYFIIDKDEQVPVDYTNNVSATKQPHLKTNNQEPISIINDVDISIKADSTYEAVDFTSNHNNKKAKNSLTLIPAPKLKTPPTLILKGTANTKKYKAASKQNVRVVDAQPDASKDITVDTTWVLQNKVDQTIVKEIEPAKQNLSVAVAELKQDEPQKKQYPNDSLVKSVLNEKNNKPGKWTNEWTVAAGRSLFASFDFSKQQEDLFFDPSNSGSIPTSPGANLRQRNEYRFKPGMYLGAGIQLGKNLTKRILFITGVHYSYQSGNVDKKVSVDSVTNIGTSASYTTISSNLYHERLTIHSINIPLLLRFSLSKNIDIDAGLYNNVAISGNWNRYAEVLGKQKKYLPVFHLNPSYVSGKFSVGPFANIGLRQYGIGQNFVNYGLMLKYNPKK